MPELPSEAGALYGLPLEEFTPARNELAKQLRKDKRKDEAAVVAKLRKPPVTAWALNQLARADPGRITAVEEAGAALRSAMDQALAGDRSGLTDAQSAERRAIQQAVEAAAKLMASAGHAAADTARRRMGESLRAAVLDAATWEQIWSGTLEDDVEATGLGLGLVAGPAGGPVGSGAPAGLGAGAEAGLGAGSVSRPVSGSGSGSAGSAGAAGQRRAAQGSWRGAKPRNPMLPGGRRSQRRSGCSSAGFTSSSPSLICAGAELSGWPDRFMPPRPSFLIFVRRRRRRPPPWMRSSPSWRR